jgi:ribosomal protein S6--L-glutamate ligase
VGDALAAFQDAGNPVLYIQKLLRHPGRDLGLAFLGGEYLVTYARVGSRDSWNTTTRTGGRYAPHEPTPEVIDLARRAQEPFGLDFTCVDVMETDGGPVVLEVSPFGGFRGIQEAWGIDAAERYVDHALRRLEK